MHKTKYLFICIIFTAAALSGIFLGSVWSVDSEIIFKLRLPRVVLAIFVGGGLSVSGAVFQGILRNPLADPYMLGSAAGAAVGALISAAFALDYLAAPLAFLFSLAAVMVVFYISFVSSGGTMKNLILVGVSVNIFLSGIIIFCFYIMNWDSYSLMHFILGSLSENDPKILIPSAVAISMSAALIYISGNIINILTLGREKARTLGVDTERWEFASIFLVSLIVGVSVAAAGIIGFVGFVAPHVARIFFGANYRRLIPVSFLLGSIFLITGDVIARVSVPPIEIPVGVVTAVMGAPFFIYVLSRMR